MRPRPALLALLAPLLVAPPAAAVQAVDGGATAEAVSPLLRDVHLIGASVTDGFGLDLELEVGAGLAEFVDAALHAAHGEVVGHGNGMFFSDPRRIGAKQIDAALEGGASLVLALDFLFWYGYGTRAEDARPALLEEGLAQLDRLGCPMVVADLPDMSPALQGVSPLTGGPLIARSQIPASETLAALNARVAEWAAERPHVALLPLADFVARLRADQELQVAGRTLPAGAGPGLLQSDLLHATVEGTAVFALLALDALDRAHEDFGPEAFAHELAAVVAGVWDLTEDEREKKRAREERLEELRRKRAEREKESGGGGALVVPGR